MLIKNKIILSIISIFISLLCAFYVAAEELDISASEVIFEKDKKLMIATGSVIIIDSQGNKIKTEKAKYDKIKNEVTTYNKTQISFKNGYEITSSKIIYDNENKLIFSNELSNIIDTDGNLISVNMFEYLIEKNLFSSKGKIKIIDINKNKYFFEEMYIDTKNKKIIGSDIRASFVSEDIGGLSNENEPRLAANSAFISEEKSEFNKGIFTTCKKKGEKCPLI